jgi:uncharacterized membrane protein
MEFICNVEIEKPIEKVIQLFINPDNLKEWQDGFVSMEHISGTPWQAGAKSKLVYNSGKRVIELVETIQANNLPNELTALYEHKHMVNTMRYKFTSLGENKTRMEYIVEYSKLIGLMPKLMAALMPGMFKRQAQKWLDQFKRFAENNKNR